MNKRINEIDLQLGLIRKELDGEYESLNKELKTINENITWFISTEFDFPIEIINLVCVSDYSTKIEVKCDDGVKTFGSDITIYHDRRYNDKREYSIGYFSTGVSESSTQDLYYLELLGKISKDFRTKKTFIKELAKALKTIRGFTKKTNELHSIERSLKHEKSELIQKDIVNKILSDKGIKLKASTRGFIRDTDSRQSYVRELKILKKTDNTITIQYINDGGYEIDTYRQNIYDAERTLVTYFRRYENQCKVNEEDLAKRLVN